MEAAEFAVFFKSEYPALVRHVFLRGFTRDIAVDAAQEAMIRLLTSRDDVRQPRAWIRTTAYRVALATLHDEQRRDQVYRKAATLSWPVPAVPSDKAEQRDEAERATECIKQLPERQRDVMAWFYDGYSPKEIAQMLGIPRATVDSNLRHARKKLKSLLGGADTGEEML
ncbi:RNA polymerase sigma factor [Streptomyces sp. NPDC094472]|uniref:RNA polymerase sigma factor n=1 Tax=Streptomyces sp. NPDC094472 TaxID=3155080 RepID=UPI00331E1058